MKFVCDACGARYHIDDKKVAGKVLRIRCKKCSHVITVREPSRPAERASVPALSPPAPSTAETIEWFYSVNGQTLGPYGEEALLQLFHKGRVGDEAYVWHAGFGDWKPAAEVPVFSSAIIAAKDAARQRGVPRTQQLSAIDVQSSRVSTQAMQALEVAAKAVAPAQPQEIATPKAQEAKAQEDAAAETQELAPSKAQEIASAKAQEVTAPKAKQVAAPEAQDLDAEDTQEIASTKAQEIAAAKAKEGASKPLAGDATTATLETPLSERPTTTIAREESASTEPATAPAAPAKPSSDAKPKSPTAKLEASRQGLRERRSRAPEDAEATLEVTPSDADAKAPAKAVPPVKDAAKTAASEDAKPKAPAESTAELSDSQSLELADTLELDELAGAAKAAKPAQKPRANASGAPAIPAAARRATGATKALEKPSGGPNDDGADDATVELSKPAADKAAADKAAADKAAADKAAADKAAADKAAADKAAADKAAADKAPKPQPTESDTGFGSLADSIAAAPRLDSDAAPLVGLSADALGADLGADFGVPLTDAAPSESLIFQVSQAKSRTRRTLGLLALALMLGTLALVLLNRRPTAEDAVVVEPERPIEENELRVEQSAAAEATRARNRQVAFVRARRGVSTAYASALDAQRPAAEQAAAVAENTANGSRPRSDERPRNGERSASAAEQAAAEQAAGQLDEAEAQEQPGRAVDRQLGIALPLPTPSLAEEEDVQEGPGGEHFAEGLRTFVNNSIVRCNQRHVAEEGVLEHPRVELSLTVQPSGRVSGIRLPRELQNTAFGRCLQTHRERWTFPSFRGEAVTLQKTYVVQ